LTVQDVEDPFERDVGALAPYEEYVEQVEEAARTVLTGEELSTSALAALDGAPSIALSSLVPLSTRRRLGAFFTSGEVRDVEFRSLLPTTRRDRAALDPACGAGDLLLSWTQTLPADRDLESTLHRWANLINGSDIAPAFVRLARARLVLAAAARCPGSHPAQTTLEDAFPGIRVSDVSERLFPEALPAWTLMNPPFGRVRVPKSTAWTSGSVSEAAIFVDQFLKAAAPGQSLVAILPDVLRTGATLSRWRSVVESMATVSSIRPIGQFNQHADVDVFVVRMCRAKRTRQAAWWPTPQLKGKLLGEIASIHVGPLVPYRHMEAGPLVPYVHPRNVPASGITQTPSQLRRFDGRLIDPPFVAIRRTSRPGDRPRAKAVVIEGDAPVAVENHMIVVTPASRSTDACVSLAASLTAAESSRWLDERLRGRHLTVTALRGLPVEMP
jgi:hypothetical protein